MKKKKKSFNRFLKKKGKKIFFFYKKKNHNFCRFFEETVHRAKKVTKSGFRFLDVGVSGGPSGARSGACLMIGGEKKDFIRLKNLFADLSVPDGFGYMGGHGAGHFVKMVHNGIEYGMMQALSEGFAIMKKSPLKPDLTE